MTLPDLTQPKPKAAHELKEGVVMYSKTTEIFYKKVKGVLMKNPSYGGSEKGWTTSAYRGTTRHFVEADKKQIFMLKMRSV